ncbi:MAG: hypothetical protein AB7P00_38150 [Sandaracinaceae bacterium]
MSGRVLAAWLAAFLALGCDDGSSSDGGTGGRDAGPRADGSTPDAGGRAAGAGSDGGARDAGPTPMPTFGCAPLGAPSGATMMITPAQADDLPSLIGGAAAGTTILLADGTYTSTRSGEAERRIQIRNPGITLRSASGDASAVTIDAEYMTNELITITADDVTIAEITLMHAVDHLVHATGNGGTTITGTRLYGVTFIDAGEQFVKVNGDGMGGYVDGGELACSRFELTDAGRAHVERNPGGCYTGGIDCHSGRGWRVAQNTFTSIYCAGEGLAEHAIHFWSQARDTVVENNTIIDCARGIGFGLDQSDERRTYPDDPYSGIRPISHFDGIIRNNVIFAETPYYDTGIELQRARGAVVVHNTITSTPAATGFFSSLDYRFTTTDVTIQNNVTRRITVRDGASGTVDHNLEMAPMSLFVDPAAYDFHLASGASQAIDQGVVVSESGVDLDGEAHDHGAPDLGADER